MNEPTGFSGPALTRFDLAGVEVPVVVGAGVVSSRSSESTEMARFPCGVFLLEPKSGPALCSKAQGDIHITRTAETHAIITSTPFVGSTGQHFCVLILRRPLPNVARTGFDGPSSNRSGWI